MGFSDWPAHTTFRYANNKTSVLRYGSDYIVRSKITELFLANLALRELTQREETLHYRAMASQKAVAIESNGTQVEKANKELEEAEAQFRRKEYVIYSKETMLEAEFKEPYDSLRRDTKWFMREEMIQDCSGRGGCCSRECGYCEQRHISKRKRGKGHCTVECWCCITFRGYELPERKKRRSEKI